jgi:SAM-dependent methyltransferase
MKPQLKPDYYFDKLYDYKGRFCSYWHQIDEVISLKPKRVLEIGIGNGIVSDYLKKRGLNLTTLDVNEKLHPDIVGNILNLPFPEKTFDVVTCFEMLEHLPYEDFNQALLELFKVSKLYAILSLPDINRVYRLNVQIPKIGDIRILIPLPRTKRLIHSFGGTHYWNIGETECPLFKIIKDIHSVGFNIEKTYRVFEEPLHHFFVLKK